MDWRSQVAIAVSKGITWDKEPNNQPFAGRRSQSLGRPCEVDCKLASTACSEPDMYSVAANRRVRRLNVVHQTSFLLPRHPPPPVFHNGKMPARAIVRLVSLSPPKAGENTVPVRAKPTRAGYPTYTRSRSQTHTHRKSSIVRPWKIPCGSAVRGVSVKVLFGVEGTRHVRKTSASQLELPLCSSDNRQS